MRVLLDECMPKDFKKWLDKHDCMTAGEAGLAGKKNGVLLKAIASKFDVFVTVDKSLRYQQNLKGIPFGIVVLRARGNRLEDLAPLAAKALEAIDTIKPGQVSEVGV